MFAVDDYDEEFFPKLYRSVKQMENLAKVLHDLYGFEVDLLKNPTRIEVLRALNKIRQKVGRKDNLLIFYAGHSVKMNGRNYYWPMKDANNNKTTWLNTADVLLKINSIRCRNMLMVADAAYVGAICPPKTGNNYLTKPFITKNKYSFQVMTSGTKPGQNPFMGSLIKELKRNQHNSLSALSIFNKVMNSSIVQSMKEGFQFCPLYSINTQEKNSFTFTKQISIKSQHKKDIVRKGFSDKTWKLMDKAWIYDPEASRVASPNTSKGKESIKTKPNGDIRTVAYFLGTHELRFYSFNGKLAWQRTSGKGLLSSRSKGWANWKDKEETYLELVNYNGKGRNAVFKLQELEDHRMVLLNQENIKRVYRSK